MNRRDGRVLLEVSPLEKADDDVPLVAIIVYDKGAAYRRGLHLLVNLDRVVGGGIDVRPLPWRIAELDFADQQTLALENARAADMVIISVTGPVELPETLRRWLLSCRPTRADRPNLLIVALLGNSEAMDPPETPRHQFLKRAADEAGFHFLAPTSPRRKQCTASG